MNKKDNTQIKKRRLQGVVTSDKMAKTRVVAVSRLKRHRKYQKYYRVTTKFKAHDEANEFHAGDTVIIEEGRPRSKEKRWAIIKKI
ncbi:MAG: 30S ribosomal protein S17 [Candidatus Liptonbacteria bacterium]|nr:30S ribosomal protein S17 [Candidatus Liptonbacteria bacterium]